MLSQKYKKNHAISSGKLTFKQEQSVDSLLHTLFLFVQPFISYRQGYLLETDNRNTISTFTRVPKPYVADMGMV